MILGKTDFPHICLLYLYIYIYIYILHTSKPIYITICLWIFLSTDNVLTLPQHDTGGSIGRVTWLELKSEKCEL